MIDWLSYKPGQMLELKISEDEKEYRLNTILEEYEWSHHRKPHLAIIVLTEASDDGIWRKGDKIKLPILWDDLEEHAVLVCTHEQDNSIREIARNTIISLNLN
jgi:hypothetical protein